MKCFILISAFFLTVSAVNWTQAACPLDHIAVGCNPDGDPNTPDDDQLYLDVSKKYRRTTLEGNWPQDYYKNWHYPMSAGWGGTYLLGEPGLDLVSDPNHLLQQSFDLKVECVSISDDLTVLNSDFQPLAEQAGDVFDYTNNLSAGHVHLTYLVTAGGENRVQWFTFRITDATGRYQPSEICTLIFCRPPIPGDIRVDDVVDILDLEKLACHWLLTSDDGVFSSDGLAGIDVFDGADINRDYTVNMVDWAAMAKNWFLLN